MDPLVSTETFELYRRSKFSKLDQHNPENFLSIVKDICELSPDKSAVLNASWDALSYREIEVHSTRFAQYLLRKLSEKKMDIDSCDIVVSIALTKTNVMIVPLYFAVLKLGGALYVAEEKLGISVNMERIRRIGTDLIVVDDGNLDLAEAGNGHNITTVNITDILNDVRLNDVVDSTDSAWLGRRSVDRAGYYMFSSGTTGKPKCMYLSISFMSNLVRTSHEVMRMNNSSRVLQLSRRNFDVFHLDVICSIGNGATLILMDHETARHPHQFEEFVNSFGVTWAIITPGHLELLLQPTTSFIQFESLMTAGEACSKGLIKRIIWSGVHHVMNGYGPSEGGIAAMCADVYDSMVSNELDETVSLGQACVGTSVRVLRQKEGSDVWKLCSFGEQGELFITNCLQNVYDDEKLNQTKYVTMNDPISGNSHRFYRTGDIVAISGDGEMSFVGRRDNQVKIFGQLVVTDEVRVQLERICEENFPNEKVQFHISVHHNTEGKPIGINAHHTATNQAEAEVIATMCSNEIRKKLPVYMLPKNYLWLPEFKLKIGGKLDTAHIMENGTESLNRNAGTPPSDDIERKIAYTWSQTIGRRATDWCLEDKFSEFGGDSMLMIVMCSSVNEAFDVSIKTTDFIGNDSLGAIADIVRVHIAKRKAMKMIINVDGVDNVDGGSSREEIPSLVKLRENVDSEYSLYCVHPGDGQVRVYKPLAAQFPDSYSVYGIRAPGSEPGEDILNLTIKEYAKRYAQLVMKQSMLDKKDINLFSYCGGGPIAVELARTLQNSGFKVKSLTLCDPPNPYDRDENNDTSGWLATFFNDRYGLAIDEKELRAPSPLPTRKISEPPSNALTRKASEPLQTKSRRHAPLTKRLSVPSKTSVPSKRLQRLKSFEKISEKPRLKRQFTEQFDTCINEVVMKGANLRKSYSFMKDSLKEVATDMEERNELMRSMKNAEFREESEKRFSTMMVGEFATQFFPGTIEKKDLEAFGTYEEMIEEFVKLAHAAGVFPMSIGVSFFLSLLQVGRELFNAIYDYVPTPLHLKGGRILYCSTRPNENRVSLFYPNFETWKEVIPQARSMKFSEWDHSSIFLEASGLERLVSVITKEVESDTLVLTPS